MEAFQIMEALDLTAVYSLFLEGMAIGGLLSAIPFILGYAINFLVQLCQK